MALDQQGVKKKQIIKINALFFILICLLYSACLNKKNSIRTGSASLNNIENQEESVKTELFFQKADHALSKKDWEAALDYLREFRLQKNQDRLKLGLSLLKSAEIVIKSGEAFRAFYFLRLFEKMGLEQEKMLIQCYRLYAEAYKQCYDSRKMLEYYRILLDDYHLDEPLLFLESAEIYLYELKKERLAKLYFSKVSRSDFQGKLLSRYNLLGKRLFSRRILPTELGLQDDSVSALALDYDDLWIGTWTGGVCRYNLSSSQYRVFRPGKKGIIPQHVRCLRVSEHRVWIGTYNGIYVYIKPIDRWQNVNMVQRLGLERIQDIRPQGKKIWVATLGQGLWLLDEEIKQARRIGNSRVPGDFINCLNFSAEGDLMIGTLDQGAFIYQDNHFYNLKQKYKGLPVSNVTFMLSPDKDSYWIGSYGSGLFFCNKKNREWFNYNKSGNYIQDDWVLCAALSAEKYYFGTFGAGISSLDRKSKKWFNIGLDQGLPGKDISVILYQQSYIYSGLLGKGVSILHEAFCNN